MMLWLVFDLRLHARCLARRVFRTVCVPWRWAQLTQLQSAGCYSPSRARAETRSAVSAFSS